jgi:uncharacterized protein YeaO (DUF488 family)
MKSEKDKCRVSRRGNKDDWCSIYSDRVEPRAISKEEMIE